MADDPIYTLEALVTRLGEATEPEARVAFEGMTDADIIHKGAEVGTPRLVKELSRNYGTFADWLPSATQEQLDLLGFIDADWLRVAAWCGRRAETQHEAHKLGASGGTGNKDVRVAAAAELEAKAQSARARLRTSLNHLSGGLVAWTTKIDSADATAVSISHTADALAALADVGDAMLADSSPGMVARRAKSKLTAAALADHRALATELVKAAKVAAAVKAAAPVSLAEVNLWDGLAITFFEQFVEAVDAARLEDPRIPAPTIIGLRSWFRRGKGGAKDEPVDPKGGG